MMPRLFDIVHLIENDPGLVGADRLSIVSAKIRFDTDVVINLINFRATIPSRAP